MNNLSETQSVFYQVIKSKAKHINLIVTLKIKMEWWMPISWANWIARLVTFFFSFGWEKARLVTRISRITTLDGKGVFFDREAKTSPMRIAYYNYKLRFIRIFKHYTIIVCFEVIMVKRLPYIFCCFNIGVAESENFSLLGEGASYIRNLYMDWMFVILI